MAYKLINMWTPSTLFRYKSPYAMTPTTVTIHNTANTAPAVNEAKYMNGNTNMVSYHAVGDDNQIIQLIPFNRNAWHAGDGQGNGNRRSIGIEIAYSMENGYSGAMSARYKKAQENVALYTAHILRQYGWGTDRLRMHYNWSRKDCPHKMRAHNGWNAFVKRVGEHLAALKKSGKPASETKSAPKKGSNNTTKKPATDNKGWKTNNHGTQWMKLEGVWINGNQEITKRRGSPKLSATSSGQMKPGQRLDYREIARSDGHIWLLDKKSNQWVPVKTWNSTWGTVGKDWGTWK